VSCRSRVGVVFLFHAPDKAGRMVSYRIVSSLSCLSACEGCGYSPALHRVRQLRRLRRISTRYIWCRHASAQASSPQVIGILDAFAVDFAREPRSRVLQKSDAAKCRVPGMFPWFPSMMSSTSRTLTRAWASETNLSLAEFPPVRPSWESDRQVRLLDGTSSVRVLGKLMRAHGVLACLLVLWKMCITSVRV
jgi:hypothetical protein